MAYNVRDAVRGTITDERMRNPSFRKKVLENIKKRYEVTRVKDRFDSPMQNGYRDMLVNVRLPNGMEGEIQLHDNKIFELKEADHKGYQRLKEYQKKGDTEGINHLSEKMKGGYDKIMNEPVKVALIDDHKFGIPQIKKIYDGQPIDFHYFDSYQKFKEYVGERPGKQGVKFDAVYIDYDLGRGKTDGANLVRDIKNNAYKVVGFSDNEGHDKDMKAMGADHFIVKSRPYNVPHPQKGGQTDSMDEQI